MNGYTFAFAAILTVFAPSPADDRKKKGEPESTKNTHTGPLTLLGSVKGDLTKVSDGGNKIEIKYKDIVTAPRPSSGQGAVNSSKVRLPRTTLKEKNQELELRVLATTVIRLMHVVDDKKGDNAKKAEEAARSAADKDEEDADEMNKSKDAKKPGTGTRERSLPGKPGQRKDLGKGQVVIVTVAREDLPGFSRLVATSIYVLGEK